MSDHSVLDYNINDGQWRRWRYDPTNQMDILPGPPLSSGDWGKKHAKGLQLFAMPDGKVLGLNPSGHWFLWRYDPSQGRDPLSQLIRDDDWDSIEGYPQLLPLRADRTVIQFDPASGAWHHWTYDAEKRDVLPKRLDHGLWDSFRGHVLIEGLERSVMDIDPADGVWRLWQYDPRRDDILPDPQLLSGRSADLVGAHEYILMPDDKILQWSTATAQWRLWGPAEARTTIGHAGTGFEVASHGYKFVNQFVVAPTLSSDSEANMGLCGGMSLSALRRWRSGLPVSELSRPPETKCPELELFWELFSLQLETFTKHGVALKVTGFTMLPNPNVATRTLDVEWPKARKTLDTGSPVVLCLMREPWMSKRLHKNHQVLAIGYRLSQIGSDGRSERIEIDIYDPNHPHDKSRPDDARQVLTLERGRQLEWCQSDGAAIRAFFVVTDA